MKTIHSHIQQSDIHNTAVTEAPLAEPGAGNTAVAEVPPAEPGAGNGRGALSRSGRRLMARTMRFLVGIYPPDMFRRACAHGYSLDEHSEGWRLVRLAGGERRPAAEHDPHGDVAPVARDKLEILRELDGFENLWFPRVRAIIRRIVPSEHRGAFEAAFFRDLEQQPLGPGVVLSVGTFLSRLASLETSKLPGARDVLATLNRRGLRPERLEQVRALIREIETPRIDTPVPTAVDAQREQEQALEALRSWFGDWATTLRSELSSREQLALGLKVRRASADTEADDSAEEEVKPAAPVVAPNPE